MSDNHQSHDNNSDITYNTTECFLDRSSSTMSLENKISEAKIDQLVSFQNEPIVRAEVNKTIYKQRKHCDFPQVSNETENCKSEMIHNNEQKSSKKSKTTSKTPVVINSLIDAHQSSVIKKQQSIITEASGGGGGGGECNIYFNNKPNTNASPIIKPIPSIFKNEKLHMKMSADDPFQSPEHKTTSEMQSKSNTLKVEKKSTLSSARAGDQEASSCKVSALKSTKSFAINTSDTLTFQPMPLTNSSEILVKSNSDYQSIQPNNISHTLHPVPLPRRLKIENYSQTTQSQSNFLFNYTNTVISIVNGNSHLSSPSDAVNINNGINKSEDLSRKSQKPTPFIRSSTKCKQRRNSHPIRPHSETIIVEPPTPTASSKISQQSLFHDQLKSMERTSHKNISKSRLEFPYDSDNQNIQTSSSTSSQTSQEIEPVICIDNMPSSQPQHQQQQQEATFQHTESNIITDSFIISQQVQKWKQNEQRPSERLTPNCTFSSGFPEDLYMIEQIKPCSLKITEEPELSQLPQVSTFPQHVSLNFSSKDFHDFDCTSVHGSHFIDNDLTGTNAELSSAPQTIYLKPPLSPKLSKTTTTIPPVSNEQHFEYLLTSDEPKVNFQFPRDHQVQPSSHHSSGQCISDNNESGNNQRHRRMPSQSYSIAHQIELTNKTDATKIMEEFPPDARVSQTQGPSSPRFSHYFENVRNSRIVKILSRSPDYTTNKTTFSKNTPSITSKSSNKPWTVVEHYEYAPTRLTMKSPSTFLYHQSPASSINTGGVSPSVLCKTAKSSKCQQPHSSQIILLESNSSEQTDTLQTINPIPFVTSKKPNSFVFHSPRQHQTESNQDFGSSKSSSQSLSTFPISSQDFQTSQPVLISQSLKSSSSSCSIKYNPTNSFLSKSDNGVHSTLSLETVESNSKSCLSVPVSDSSRLLLSACAQSEISQEPATSLTSQIIPNSEFSQPTHFSLESAPLVLVSINSKQHNDSPRRELCQEDTTKNQDYLSIQGEDGQSICSHNQYSLQHANSKQKRPLSKILKKMKSTKSNENGYSPQIQLTSISPVTSPVASPVSSPVTSPEAASQISDLRKSIDDSSKHLQLRKIYSQKDTNRPEPMIPLDVEYNSTSPDVLSDDADDNQQRHTQHDELNYQEKPTTTTPQHDFRQRTKSMKSIKFSQQLPLTTKRPTGVINSRYRNRTSRWKSGMVMTSGSIDMSGKADNNLSRTKFPSTYKPRSEIVMDYKEDYLIDLDKTINLNLCRLDGKVFMKIRIRQNTLMKDIILAINARMGLPNPYALILLKPPNQEVFLTDTAITLKLQDESMLNILTKEEFDQMKWNEKNQLN